MHKLDNKVFTQHWCTVPTWRLKLLISTLSIFVYDIPLCYVRFSEAVQSVGHNCEDFILSLLNVSAVLVGRDSSVGIATPYGLDGPGIEYRWGRDFPHPSRPTLGPTQPHIEWVLGVLPCGWSGRGVPLTTHSHLSPRLKKECSYTSTPPLGFSGLFLGDLYLYFYMFQLSTKTGTCSRNEIKKNTFVTDGPCFLAVETPCTLFDISVTFGPMSKFLVHSRSHFFIGSSLSFRHTEAVVAWRVMKQRQIDWTKIVKIALFWDM